MPHLSSQHVVPALAALHAGEFQSEHAADAPRKQSAQPFLTITRQAGAGGHSLALQLVECLKQVDPGDRPWTVWENELAERVAREYHLPAARVAALEDKRPSWLEELLAGFSISAGGSN